MIVRTAPADHRCFPGCVHDYGPTPYTPLYGHATLRGQVVRPVALPPHTAPSRTAEGQREYRERKAGRA